MPPELEIVHEWLVTAAEDLQAARCLLRSDCSLPQPASFHCQQAVEKGLKAFLEYREMRPPKTHALAELLDLAESLDPQFSEIRDAQWLTQFAVEARYPGSALKPPMERARQALAAAEEAFRFILARLPEQVRP